MTNIKHCIGVLSYCDSDQNPRRFEILKESVLSMSALKKEDNYMFVWDNNSSNDVKDFLKSCHFFNDVFLSDQNFYDNAPITLLNQKAKELGAEFVTFMCDDSLVYDAEAVPYCFEFLRLNPDCGYVRILKYEFDRMSLYDKMSGNPNVDRGNCQRHFNTITNQGLTWEPAEPRGKYKFLKNNWHWTEFPNVCRAEVFDKMVPRVDCGPMQALEGTMMRTYHSLGLKTGVLDGGAVTHNQDGFHAEASIRVKDFVMGDKKKVIVSYGDLEAQIQRVCHG